VILQHKSLNNPVYSKFWGDSPQRILRFRMSEIYILEKLKEIDNLEKRTEEAERLVECFSDRIRNGAWNPPMPWSHGYSNDDDIKRWLQEEEKFYEQVKDLCGGKLPKLVDEGYEKYKKNRKHAEELLQKERFERNKLNLHEFFPYWEDFDKVIHKILRGARTDIPLEELTFSNEMIGKGGFGTLYKTRDKGGKEYALKLFHPSMFFYSEVANARRAVINLARENLTSQKNAPSERPFIPIRTISFDKDNYDHELYPPLAYIMDFFQGESIEAILKHDKNKLKDKKLVGNTLLTYATMLEMLHYQKKVFMDNNWGGVLVRDEEIGICDCDFITPIEKLSNYKDFPGHRSYFSREHLLKQLPSYVGDLEGFALMIDELFYGKPIIETIHQQIAHEEKAKENKRKYSESRINKLPDNLRQIVPLLISYPRDDSITATDFVSAIKKDFGL
jgi:hypothetical protein